MTLEAKICLPSFTDWRPFKECSNIPHIDRPGVYAIAISDIDISGSAFSLRPEIRYFGMTISKGGLANRLSQFHGALFGKDGPHGGAWRFKFDYPNAAHLLDYFFVSVVRFDCSPTRNTSNDLREMGKVLSLEYVCFADFMDIFGHLPKYNDKSLRPKKYYGIGPNQALNPDPTATSHFPL